MDIKVMTKDMADIKAVKVVKVVMTGSMKRVEKVQDSKEKVVTLR